MALVHAIAGALRPGQEITWTRDDGSAEDLSNATVTGVLFDTTTGATRAIAGTIQVSDGPNGVFIWNYDLADVVYGTYLVQFTASFVSGATPARTFLTPWRVNPSL